MGLVRIIKSTVYILLLIIILLSYICFAKAYDEFISITGPCNLEFPKDHGPHLGYKTEWWYYTGNLISDIGQEYGFQLTFFRQQLVPTKSKNLPQNLSKWRTNQLIIGHIALSDISESNYYHAESISRQALNIADVRDENIKTTIYLKNWSAQIKDSHHILKAITDDFSFDLDLNALKNPVMHGENGYSKKGKKSESSSCYYSFTRLITQGLIRIKNKQIKVSGLSWMDHEFSSAPLEQNIEGWDWFSLQFDNQTELMLYFLRQKDKSFSKASSGTFVDSKGNSHDISLNEINIKILDYWESKKSNAIYPSKWRIQIAPFAIEIVVKSALENQEMESSKTTGVTYWEGSVSFKGKQSNQSVHGKGYVELTGYAKPFDAPM